MFKSIIPATDWFFVHEHLGVPIVLPLAAWALDEQGKTIGLVGASERTEGTERGVLTLSPVPPIAGSYLHREQLNAVEIEALERRSVTAPKRAR